MSRALVAALLLAGCAGGIADTSANTPARMGVSFVPDSAGLSVPTVGKRVDFGRSPKGVIPLLTRELGTPRALGVAGCPSGVVQQVAWDGLTLSFSSERFVGWRQNGASAGKVCAAV